MANVGDRLFKSLFFGKMGIDDLCTNCNILIRCNLNEQRGNREKA
ncbi:hypothetical protein C2W64_00646 [Brevibacillus laterosporus]|nr:hypothetical protein C2W64_00646 [Brevibacillus laterosporus]